MKITKKQLQEMIHKAIKTALKEDQGSANPEVEAQLEDAVGVLEMISQRILSFPTQDQNAASQLPKVIDALEKIDGFLGKFVSIENQVSEDTTSMKIKSDDFAHGGKIPLSKIKEKASGIHSDYVIGAIKDIASMPSAEWNFWLGDEFARAFQIAFRGWAKEDMMALAKMVSDNYQKSGKLKGN